MNWDTQPLGFSWNKPDSQELPLARTQGERSVISEEWSRLSVLLGSVGSVAVVTTVSPAWHFVIQDCVISRHGKVVFSPLSSWCCDVLSTRHPSLLSPQFFSDARDLESFLRNLQESIKRKYSCDHSTSLSRLEDLLQDSMVGVASVGWLLLRNRVNPFSCCSLYPWKRQGCGSPLQSLAHIQLEFNLWCSFPFFFP